MDARTAAADFYPAIKAYDQGRLDVGDGHQLYWEQSGNPEGQPVVFLHGGPGSGCSPQHSRFFDPGHYRIVLFDQRGAGLSTPYAATQANTTEHLVGDIEQLRRHLGIDSWLVFGGSWGSTLALVYAIAHRRRCRGLILRGIFLASGKELDWFLRGMAAIFPEAQRQFIDFLPAPERDEPLASYYARLIDPDPHTHLPAAAAWSRYETACSTLRPGPAAATPPTAHDTAHDTGDPGKHAGWKASLAIARIEAHYFVNRMFLEPDYILNNMDKLKGLPGAIIQGRYDIVCPIVTADRLAAAWRDVNGGDDGGLLQYTIVNEAGHSAMEPGIRSALVAACDDYRKL